MTTASANAGFLRSRSSRALNTSLFAAEPLFAATGYLFALSLLVTATAMSLDARLFQGENIWIKPIKFQVALTVFLLTLAFFARYLPPGMTGRLSYRIYAAVVVFTIVSEMLWIGGAAMFGVASHFNQSSTLMAMLYPLMGVFAVTLTSATLVYGVAIWRHQQSELNSALRLSIALGLCLTFLLTVPVASTLSSSTSHFVGVPMTGATVPIMGWSREVGDLRIAHFLATHAMHFVPLLGLLAAWLLNERSAIRAVWVLSLAFAGLVAFTFGQALSGLPLIPLS